MAGIRLGPGEPKSSTRTRSGLITAWARSGTAAPPCSTSSVNSPSLTSQLWPGPREMTSTGIRLETPRKSAT